MSGLIEGTGKITAVHLERMAMVYVRQSSPRQVMEHVESRRRQYQLAEAAVRLGWPAERVVTIDEDQGKSGAVARAREGFGRLIRAVGAGEVGIIFSLEVSRLARNSPDWYNLIYMSRFTQTLIADGDTIYDPTRSGDRMVLGLRGQVSELELDALIQRMVAARWSQAHRGEARSIPPTGYEYSQWGELEMASDEAVVEALRTVFTKFDELGSVSHVCQYLRESGQKFPVRRPQLPGHPVVWLETTYAMVWRVLHHPIYAGAYVYGRTQTVRDIDPEDPLVVRVQRHKRTEWPVLIRDHHPAYISYDQYLRNQELIGSNSPMGVSGEGNERGPAREGAALLQGLVLCGTCGRLLHTSYPGRSSSSSGGHYYRCPGVVDAVGENRCQTINGKRLDASVVSAFLAVVAEAGPAAAEIATVSLREERERLSRYWALQIEKAEYASERAARQYDAVEPENRTVARELERRWNQRIEELEQLRHQASRALGSHQPITEKEVALARRLGGDLEVVWEAATTAHRDRKRLLRCLIEEVQVWSEEHSHRVRILWRGGATTDQEIRRIRRGQAHVAQGELVELVRVLARELNDAQIARVLARRSIYNMHGAAYTRGGIVKLRQKHGISACEVPRARDPSEGPFSAQEAARELGVCEATIHRWLREGVLRGGQAAPGAPWRIVLTEDVRRRLTAGDAPPEWVGLGEASRRLGTAKSTVAHWVNSGRLRAVRVMRGRRSCWRIDLSSIDEACQIDLVDQMQSRRSRDGQ